MNVCLNEAGGIYFISHENDRDFVKIGMATSFSNRIANFFTGTPHKICIELIFPVSSINETALSKLEREFHEKFCDLRYKREWFANVGPLKSFINTFQASNSSALVSASELTIELQGCNWLDVDWGKQSLPGYPLHHDLSEKELEVARLVALGMSTQEIADVKGLSAETIKSQITGCLTKLSLPNRTALATHVVRSGWE